MADITIDGTTIGANRFLFLDSTGKIPAVDGSQVTAIAAGNIATGTIPIARIDTGTTANKIVKLDGNAKLPALDGSQITNMPGATKSSSNPTVSTNPSGGVGTEWHNTTSGESYICTDATTGANVWTNVGAGTGDVQPYSQYAGTQYGYTTGGTNRLTTIDRFSFTSDGNSADWADTSGSRSYTCGQSSGTHGYITGKSSTSDHIEKYPFASQTQGTIVGSLSVAAARGSAAGMGSETYGYTAGGEPTTDVIDKFSFATDGNAVDVGNTLATVRNVKGNASTTHGYIMGGHPGSTPYLNTIQKFTFASDANATDVGDLTYYVKAGAGQNSETHGYQMGGSSASGVYPTTGGVQKWTFASDANATTVGNTTYGTWSNAGHSSPTYGYQSGGSAGGNGNTIEKVSFTTDGNATDVGDLTVSGSYISGNHY
jgi:hypothetical protein